MQNKYKILYAIVLLLLLVPQVAFAQTSKKTPTPTPLKPLVTPETGVNVTLSPTFLSLVTDPGKEVTGQFKIRNNNNFTEYFELNLAKFEAAEGGERPLLVNLTPQDTFRDWISFSEKQFTVDANESKTITVSINAPKSAALGYYYAIMVDRIKDKTSEDNGAVVSGAPAILTLLEVRTPNAKRELELVDFSAGSLFYEYLPATFTIKVKNKGNIHTAPVGDIFIDSSNKKDISVLHINEGRGNVLPNSAREFTTQWSDGFGVRVPKEENGQAKRDGKGNIIYTTSYDFSKADRLRIGKYTAHLLMVYDNGERDVPVEATVSFWVIPWKILGGGLVLLLLALFGLRSIIVTNLRRFRRK